MHDIIAMPVSAIGVGERMRARDDKKVGLLAESIASIGLLNPIVVDENGQLIAGLHRLEAHKVLGLAEIEARVLSLDEIDTELAQIDENLMRNELTVLEQGEHLERRNELLAARGERAPSHRPEKGETVSPLRRTEDIAGDAGLSKRSAQQRMQAARDIAPDVRDAIRNTPVANSTTQLLDLARMPEEEQREVSQKIAAGEASSVRDARDKMSVHFSSDSPEWYTPEHVIDAVTVALGGIDLDPCSNSHESPNVPAGLHFTEADNGLVQPWRGKVYMNPPYGREIGEWIDKLISSYEGGAVTEAVALVPARTDAAWFFSLRDYPRCFIRGRLKFSQHGNSAPFPSVAVYLGNDTEAFNQAFSGLGDTFVRWSNV